MSVNYLAIGKRIRKLRLAKKWTQDTLGYNAGVSKVHISHIEKATTIDAEAEREKSILLEFRRISYDWYNDHCIV